MTAASTTRQSSLSPTPPTTKPGAALATITQEEGSGEDVLEFFIMCKGVADEIEVSVDPGTVEIVPAVGNTAHALITVEFWDEFGGPPLPNTEVQYERRQLWP